MRRTRAQIIGHQLDADCKRANTAHEVFGTYCYGLYDEPKCLHCHAYAYGDQIYEDWHKWRDKHE